MSLTLETKLKEFEEVVLGSNGVIMPQRTKAAFFSKCGMENLWNWFTQVSAHIPDTFTDAQKYAFLKAGHWSAMPTCYCGKPVAWLNRTISAYCSKECAASSPSKKAAIKAAHASANQQSRNDKRKATMLEKYGVAFNSQREEVKAILQQPMSQEAKDKQRKTNMDRYGVPCTFLRPEIRDKQDRHSSHELNLRAFVQSLGFEASTSRKIIAPYEIDIWVPEKNIGFEVNGVYWHSSHDKASDVFERVRLLDKTKAVSALGARLVHFTDIEIASKQTIVESMVRSMLGCTTRLYARNCLVTTVPDATAKEFLNDNHIQGWAPCYPFLGLIHNGTLVAVAGFAKSRFDKSVPWELVRFGTLGTHTVVGGFSKLLKAFRKRYEGAIVSYADYSRSNGDVYRRNGFTEEGISKPSYRWVSKCRRYLLNRHSAMRRNLPKLLGDGFNPDETEAENMWRNGYRRLWDCGQIKFILR